MLPRDKGGVVDHTLKVGSMGRGIWRTLTLNICRQVYGTTNLRVVDLSIVPLHIATPTQSTSQFVGVCALCLSCTIVALAYSIAEQGERRASMPAVLFTDTSDFDSG